MVEIHTKTMMLHYSKKSKSPIIITKISQIQTVNSLILDSTVFHISMKTQPQMLPTLVMLTLILMDNNNKLMVLFHILKPLHQKLIEFILIITVNKLDMVILKEMKLS